MKRRDFFATPLLFYPLLASTKERRKLIPVSHTSLSLFQTCPLWFQKKYIEKSVVEEETEALRFGNRGHKAIELGLLGKKELPSEFQYVTALMETVKEIGKHPATVLVEAGMALDANEQPCLYNEWDRKWVHGKFDVVIIRDAEAIVIDWKFGKVKENPQQLDLASFILMANYPEVKTVKTAFVFVQHNELIDGKHVRGSEVTERRFHQLRQEFARYKLAQIEEKYPPNPNGLCRGWCPNKVCPFWKPKRGEENG